MQTESDHLCFCCLRGVIGAISKKWAICIIVILGRHERMRFTEMMDNCERISPKTLTDVLKHLQETGLIRRESFAEIPPRVEYSLTEDGKTLREALVPLFRWAKERNSRYNYNDLASCAKAPDP
ncbi:MAG: helix-turn-helix domain-containing protein [Methanocalculus sp.]|uniref:winged helix-turn-helix transcriptional regulator n=1 Tax=Methanocalculus sp. TaxID=2004547 RepID=UPI00271858E1|nr:helix-turn-helix domain-containing protein [Methanocalculus sp.]MDO9540270.1 helix-turn-helix domain-containing protein [Methanocalculus sp.]